MIMPTWVFFILAMQMVSVIRVTDAYRQADASVANVVSCIIATTFHAIPTIYVFGWILLPAYGIGVH